MTDDHSHRPAGCPGTTPRDCAEAADPHDRRLVIRDGDPANLSGFEVVEMVTERPGVKATSRIVDANTVL